MLFDPKWEVQTKPEPWRQLLLDGADRIEQDGWYCGSGGIGYCVITSLAIFDVNIEFKRRALNCFRAYIGNEIVRWNDAIGRTKEEVVFAMRDCARNG